MSPFWASVMFSFAVGVPAHFVVLYILSHCDMDFKFGEIRKDILRTLVVCGLIALFDGVMVTPARHWSFYVIVGLAHAFVLKLIFKDISSTESGIVALAYRAVYFFAVLGIAASQLHGAG